jgi:hypothetical protein
MEIGGGLRFADVLLGRLGCALVTFSLLASAACVVVPVRVPTQKRDVSGKPVDLDLTFLTSGVTTRDEVAKNLAAVNTGVNQTNFFWGRWDSSKWRTTAVGFVPPEGERIWRAENLLIQFDQNGNVKTWAVVDDKELSRQLDLFDPVEGPPLDLSSPVQANVRVLHNDEVQAGLVLSSDFFEENRVTQTGQHFSLRTPRTNVLRINPTPEASYYGPVSSYTPYARPDLLLATVYLARSGEVHYGEKGRGVGKKLVMAMDPPTFLLVRRYIGQTKREAN